jgi:thioredoxin-related protein
MFIIYRKISLSTCLLLWLATALAQADTGIRFVHHMSWAQIQAKAKAENKYIFMDAYTTWCGPCKFMANNVFPQKLVGEFFNPQFISVKFQLDTTFTDDAATKERYADAAAIAKSYEVRAYPTYLFFSPDGQLVHRELGASDAAAFIAKARNAQDPDKQYYTLVRRYNKGERGSDFLRKLAEGALSAYDEPALQQYSRDYLATQSNLATAENVKFLAKITRNIGDVGFAEMLKNPAAFDSVVGRGNTNAYLKSLITNQAVYPAVAQAGEKPNWKALTDRFSAAYGQLGVQSVGMAKLVFFQQQSNWKAFASGVKEYIAANDPNFSAEELNEFAWSIFENCDDAACIGEAINWSKTAVAKAETPMFMDTYANLLYKAKRRTEALEWQRKAVALAEKGGENATGYKNTLAKMEAGKKTW